MAIETLNDVKAVHPLRDRFYLHPMGHAYCDEQTSKTLVTGEDRFYFFNDRPTPGVLDEGTAIPGHALEIPFHDVQQIRIEEKTGLCTFVYSRNCEEKIYITDARSREQLKKLFARPQVQRYTPNLYQAARPAIAGAMVLSILYVLVLVLPHIETPYINGHNPSLLTLVKGLSTLGHGLHTWVYLALMLVIAWRIWLLKKRSGPVEIISNGARGS